MGLALESYSLPQLTLISTYNNPFLCEKYIDNMHSFFFPLWPEKTENLGGFSKFTVCKRET